MLLKKSTRLNPNISLWKNHLFVGIALDLSTLATRFVNNKQTNFATPVSRCGSVGRAVVSNSRDFRFESSHWQILFTINCIEKTKLKKKSPGMAQLKNLF